MQFTNVGYDENGIISFFIENGNERKYNPFLIAYQGMVGRRILDDYSESCNNLIPRYVPIRYLKDAEITPDMASAVNWLIENVKKEGDRYYWLYDYSVSYGSQWLGEGWKSAFAQAYVSLAMLLFYTKTGEDIYREYALGAARGLVTDVSKGGCSQNIGKEQVWFEEIPGENSTHIFNAHLISIIALANVKEYLKTEEFTDCFEQAFHALTAQIEWMDTGIMSAYDRPSAVDFQLQLDSEEFGSNTFIGMVSIEDGAKKLTVDLRNAACFEPGECYAGGIDWSAEFNKDGYRKVINGRDIRQKEVEQGTIQNTYLNFSNVCAAERILKMTICYSTDHDVKVILKKNCGENGFKKLGFNGEIILPAKEKEKTVYIPTRSLFPFLSMIYHRYHVELLEEIIEIRNDISIRKTLDNFIKYMDKEIVVPTEPTLETLSVCLNTQCGLACKMCDIGIKNKEASLYKYLVGEGENQQLDPDLLVKRCNECDNSLNTVHFVGTEPTLYRKLPELVEQIKETSVLGGARQVFVTTNGINLANMLLPLIEAGTDKILISIDGPSKLHDEIRGREGLFQSIMETLTANKDKLKEAEEYGFELAACCAISPMNYLYLADMVRELGAYGIKNVWCTHMNYVDPQVASIHNNYYTNYPIGQSCIHEDMNPKKVNPWLMNESIKEARDAAEALNISFVEAPYIPADCAVWEYQRLYHRPKAVVGQKICTAPFRTMQINADGSACVMSRCYQMKMGNMKDHTLMELFYSKDMVDLRREVLNGDQWDPCKRCCAIM